MKILRKLSALALALFLVAGCAGGPSGKVSGPADVVVSDQSRLATARSFFADSPNGTVLVPESIAATSWGAEIRCRSGQVVQLRFADTFRMRWTDKGAAEPRSYAMDSRPSYAPATVSLADGKALKRGKISLKKNSGILHIAGGRFTAAYDSAAGTLAVFGEKDRLLLTVDLAKSTVMDGRRTLSVSVDGSGGYYGFGEKAGSLDKKGQMLRMWNTDAYGYRNGTDPLYVSVPFFYAQSAASSLGLFLDNPGNTFFDLESVTPGLVRLGSQTGEMDLYLMDGPTPASVLASYTSLTGRYPLPPEWSLGYQQCRYSYYPEARVLEVAEGFRSRNIPADVIYLDIDYMDSFKCFTWNDRYFPDPKSMIDRLHELGFKVITIIDPGIKLQEGYSVYDSGMKEGAFVTWPNGSVVRGSVWPGVSVFPDFFNPKVREWWGPQYRSLLSMGVDGFWNDMNEPSFFNVATKTMNLDAVHHEDNGKTRNHLELHNAYGLEMARASFEGLERENPGKRVFLLSRAGYSGLQRYAAKWTGDNTASWDHLRLSIPMGLNLAISGIPMVGADIGGYSRTPTAELYTRWMQLGALFPLYRGHAEKGAIDKEPWCFGPETESVTRSALELRYRMLPLWNQLMREQWASGLPPVRPLWFSFPGDSESYRHGDTEFLIGDSVLAVPVIEEGASSVAAYFPAGSAWLDLATGKRYEGGTTASYPVSIASVPLFVREGCIIPWSPVIQHTDASDRSVELKLPVTNLRDLPSAKAKLELLWDDGNTTDYRTAGFNRWTVTLAGGVLSIVPAEGTKGGARPSRLTVTDLSGTVLATLENGPGFAPVEIQLAKK